MNSQQFGQLCNFGCKDGKSECLPILITKPFVHDWFALRLEQKLKPCHIATLSINPLHGPYYHHALQYLEYLLGINYALDEVLASQCHQSLLQEQGDPLIAKVELAWFEHEWENILYEIVQCLLESVRSSSVVGIVLVVADVGGYSSEGLLF